MTNHGRAPAGESGHLPLDLQHRRLFRAINALIDAAHARSHGQLIEKILTLRQGLIAQITSFNELLDFLANDVVEDHLVQAYRLFFGALAHSS